MKIKIDKLTKQNIFVYSITGIIIVLSYLIFKNFNIITDFINRILSILKPFIIGGILALLLNPAVKYFEDLLPNKFSFKLKRRLAVTFAMLLTLALFLSFLQVLIPQLITSFTNLTANLSDYLADTDSLSTLLITKLHFTPEFTTSLIDGATKVLNSVGTLFTDAVPTILNYSLSVIVNIFSLIIGIIICAYILLDREGYKILIKKTFNAIFNSKQVEFSLTTYHLIIRMFNGFIVGKLIDSLLIGILTFIVLNIFGIHYALLISFIIGVTNIIPNFGPFFGAIPSGIILLLIDPIECLYFAIIILIIQQFDGNILGPYILGDSMGLPGFWILFAIILGGGLFGVLGMLLAVPAFAVIFIFVNNLIDERLAKKQIDITY